MARYIDADELLNKLPDVLPYKASVKRVLMQAPEADVVPKSEVERVYYNLQAVLEERAETKQEIAREIFEEIDTLVDDWKHSYIQSIQFIAELAELKKKYTEEKKNENQN